MSLLNLLQVKVSVQNKFLGRFIPFTCLTFENLLQLLVTQVEVKQKLKRRLGQDECRLLAHG